MIENHCCMVFFHSVYLTWDTKPVIADIRMHSLYSVSRYTIPFSLNRTYCAIWILFLGRVKKVYGMGLTFQWNQPKDSSLIEFFFSVENSLISTFYWLYPTTWFRSEAVLGRGDSLFFHDFFAPSLQLTWTLSNWGVEDEFPLIFRVYVRVILG